MPEMDGLQAAREICARWPRDERPRIVAITANASISDRDLCLAAGMDDFITKPVRAEDLRRALVGTTARGTLVAAGASDGGRSSVATQILLARRGTSAASVSV
jgi:CheY-like chemotaxis protein